MSQGVSDFMYICIISIPPRGQSSPLGPSLPIGANFTQRENAGC
jgi:hypothetical protein